MRDITFSMNEEALLDLISFSLNAKALLDLIFSMEMSRPPHERYSTHPIFQVCGYSYLSLHPKAVDI